MKTYNLSEDSRNRLLEKIGCILGRHSEILFAYAFGSFIEQIPFRDIDIGLYMKSDAAPDSRFKYEDELAEEIRRELRLPFPIDVRLINDAPVAFQFHAIRGVLIVDRNPDARAVLQAHIISRYLDMKPFLQHYLKEAYGRA